MTRESGFTLLHHYSCIVKFPFFFAAVFTSQLSSFHLKYTFPINLPSTNEISQLILHLRFKPQSLYLHHTLLSQVTSTIVWFKFWNSWFLPITTNIMDKLFFSISCMKSWFLSPIKNLYKELVTIYDSLLTKWKSMWRELLNILWMESSTTFLLVHHLYTTHVYLLTWLSNNLSMLRANKNFDITQLMQTKLGTSIICIWDYKSANPCVKLIE